MNNQLQHAADRRNQAWIDLKQRITELVKEHYRLQGKLWYEPINSELENKIKGEG